MKQQKEVAQLFSGGDFEQVSDYLAEDVEWNIYEDAQQIKGKQDVIDFCRKIAKYFKSVTTKFEMFGMIESENKVSIYGRAEFIRESKTVSIIHSCDVYEFDSFSKIKKICSYCNSKKTEE